MKITQLEQNKQFELSEAGLLPGDVFKFEGEIYMVNNDNQITNLSSGTIWEVGNNGIDCRFHQRMLVTRVQAELFIN